MSFVNVFQFGCFLNNKANAVDTGVPDEPSDERLSLTKGSRK